MKKIIVFDTTLRDGEQAPGATLTSEEKLEVARALATGQILLLAIERPEGVQYKFDDTNPDARAARLLADRKVRSIVDSLCGRLRDNCSSGFLLGCGMALKRM